MIKLAAVLMSGRPSLYASIISGVAHIQASIITSAPCDLTNGGQLLQAAATREQTRMHIGGWHGRILPTAG